MDNNELSLDMLKDDVLQHHAHNGYRLQQEIRRFAADIGCPVVAACKYKGEWYIDENKVDYDIPIHDIEERTALFYATVEHAEIRLIRQLGEVDSLEDAIFFSSLFPCDRCMKVLIDKGIKRIYFAEDHPDRNWSKRSHELAKKHGVELLRIIPHIMQVE